MGASTSSTVHQNPTYSNVQNPIYRSTLNTYWTHPTSEQRNSTKGSRVSNLPCTEVDFVLVFPHRRLAGNSPGGSLRRSCNRLLGPKLSSFAD
ncbi:unnamed protein product [Calypogeia fissa]